MVKAFAWGLKICCAGQMRGGLSFKKGAESGNLSYGLSLMQWSGDETSREGKGGVLGLQIPLPIQLHSVILKQGGNGHAVASLFYATFKLKATKSGVYYCHLPFSSLILLFAIYTNKQQTSIQILNIVNIII